MPFISRAFGKKAEKESPREETVKSIQEKEEKEMKKTLSIKGMMCNHCRAHAEKALLAVDGVVTADVSLENENATVTLSKDVSDDVLVKAITDAGYEAVVV